MSEEKILIQNSSVTIIIRDGSCSLKTESTESLKAVEHCPEKKFNVQIYPNKQRIVPNCKLVKIIRECLQSDKFPKIR